jgi:preprotein translocase subunit SecE
MARQTRQQRRARRAAATETAGAARGRSRAAAAAVRPIADTATPQSATSRLAKGSGVGRFFAECWAELKKVEWPTQRQVISATVVVLVACTIVGVYLYGADQVSKRLVQHVFLR